VAPSLSLDMIYRVAQKRGHFLRLLTLKKVLIRSAQNLAQTAVYRPQTN